MKHSFLIACCVVVLIVLNVFLLFQLKVQKERVRFEREKYSRSMEVEQIRSFVSFQDQLLQYENEGVFLSDFYVKDMEVSDSFPVTDLIGENPVLFLRFEETHCDLCINKFMEILGHIPNDFPVENVVVLCGYHNMHEYRTFVHKNNLRVGIFNIQKIGGLPMEEHDKPYFFLLDKELRIKNIHIPDKDYPERVDGYLSFIRKKYWSK